MNRHQFEAVLENGTKINFNRRGNEYTANGEMPNPLFSNDSFSVYKTNLKKDNYVGCVALSKVNGENFNRLFFSENFKVLNDGIVDLMTGVKTQLFLLTKDGLYTYFNFNKDHVFYQFKTMEEFIKHYGDFTDVAALEEILVKDEFKRRRLPSMPFGFGPMK